MNKIPAKSLRPVELDPIGIYKYVLIELKEEGKSPALFVRGSAKFEYHMEIFDNFINQAKTLGYKKNNFVCLGGGRVEAKKGSLFIYGYSKSFGRVDHEISKRLILEDELFKGFEIKTSPEGY